MRPISVVSSANFRSSSDLLKICVEMGVSTGFQAGWCHTVWAWCLPSLVHSEELVDVFFTYLQYKCRCGREGGCRRCEWCFFKPAIKLIQMVCQLLILHSAGGWCLVTGDDFHTFPHWSSITGREFVLCSLACLNNSSLSLWSPFPVCIWPGYSRLYPPSHKHLLWLSFAVNHGLSLL